MMTIDEKAKAYDDAIKRAKNINGEWSSAEAVVKHIFPNINESDDEILRKELLKAFHESDDSLYMVLTPSKRKLFIDWLEKLGECELADESVLKFKVGDVIKRKTSSVKYKVTRIADNKFQIDGGNWFDVNRMKEFELVIPNNYEWSDDDEAKVKAMCNEGNLKPSERLWLTNLKYRYQTNTKMCSADDEHKINKLIELCNGRQSLCRSTVPEYKEIDDLKDWINNLKYIINSQQSGWSENDENVKEHIISQLKSDNYACTFSDTLLEEVDNWFGKIKHRYTWIPNEDQMKALDIGIKEVWTKQDAERLMSLYKDLKNIKN